MTVNADQSQNAWRWILIAKGIGILLVVIGHFNPDFAPPWWHEMVTLIYTFHMPLFMVLSGYLYVVGKQKWSELLTSKFKRLGFPFIFIALLFLLIKLLSQLVVTLEHPINLDSLVTLLINPGKSYMPLLWFMHALLFMFALYPLLHQVLRHHAFILLLFVILALLGPSPYPGINTIVHHFPFFIAGVWLRDSGQIQLIQPKGWMRIALVSGIAFLASYWLAPKLDSGYPAHYLWLFPLGLLGSISLIAISCRLDLVNQSRGLSAAVVGAFASAGLYSMSIYLFHTLFENAVRVASFQVLGLPVSWFLPIALLAIGVGMLMPLLLEKYVLRSVGLTRRYLLGLN